MAGNGSEAIRIAAAARALRDAVATIVALDAEEARLAAGEAAAAAPTREGAAVVAMLAAAIALAEASMAARTAWLASRARALEVATAAQANSQAMLAATGAMLAAGTTFATPAAAGATLAASRAQVAAVDEAADTTRNDEARWRAMHSAYCSTCDAVMSWMEALFAQQYRFNRQETSTMQAHLEQLQQRNGELSAALQH
jgi:hypothetical protein